MLVIPRQIGSFAPHLVQCLLHAMHEQCGILLQPESLKQPTAEAFDVLHWLGARVHGLAVMYARPPCTQGHD